MIRIAFLGAVSVLAMAAAPAVAGVTPRQQLNFTWSFTGTEYGSSSDTVFATAEVTNTGTEDIVASAGGAFNYNVGSLYPYMTAFGYGPNPSKLDDFYAQFNGVLAPGQSLAFIFGYVTYADAPVGTYDYFSGALLQLKDSKGDVLQVAAKGDATVEVTAPVPEPASWSMMLGGFGLVGGALRSRKKAVVTFA